MRSAPKSKPDFLDTGIELESGPEVDARRDAALKRMLFTPHTPLKPKPEGEKKPRGRPPGKKTET